MEKSSTLLNEESNRNWFATNYFWLGTIAVVLVCAFLFLFGGNNWNPIEYNYNFSDWTDGLYFNPLFYGFLNSFGHLNLQHMLLNMLCFLIVGLYLERKIGTCKLLLLVVAFAFLSTGITAATSHSVSSIGFSGVNYAFYFYIIVDFIFILFQKTRRNKLNIIFGIIMLALIYLAMCFSGGTSNIGFEWFPYDFLHNKGHTGGAFAGLIVGLIVYISKLRTTKT